MPPEAVKLLEDMRQAACGVASFIAGRTIDDYRASLQLRWAVERGFEIVGEALTQLHRIDARTAESITNWRAIIGFRNVLIHSYAAVNPDTTWDIAVNELPMLAHEIQSLLLLTPEAS